jgi:hypothetical protein
VDYQGFKYVLTVVDEISDEVVVVLLKDKTGNTVIEACKRAHAPITSRSKSTLKTWQFDRGSEFMNTEFDIWIHQELGAQQLFSNVEHISLGKWTSREIFSDHLCEGPLYA